MKSVLRFLRLYETLYQKSKKAIRRFIRKNGTDGLEKWVEEKIETGEMNALDAYRILFSLLKNTELAHAVYYGKKAQEISFDPTLEKVLAVRQKRLQRQTYSHKNLQAYYQDHSFEETERWIQKALKVYPSLKLSYYKTFFTLSKNDYPKQAVAYGEKAVLLGADDKFKAVVETRKRWLSYRQAVPQPNMADISLKEIKSIIDNMLLHAPLEDTLQYIETFDKYDENLAVSLKVYLLRKINKTHVEETVEITMGILDKLQDMPLLKIAAARAYALKQYDKALEMYRRYYLRTQDYSVVDRIVFTYINVEQNIENGDYESHIDFLMEDVFKSLPERAKQIVRNKLYFEKYWHEGECDLAIKHGLKIVGNEKNGLYAIKLARAYFELGQISSAINRSTLHEVDKKHKTLLDVYHSYLSLEQNGFPMPKQEKSYTPDTSNILYVLNNSLPYHSNGYATRAHGLLEEIKKEKEIHAITRLGYPHDLVKLRGEAYVEKHRVENIDYYHLPSEDLWLNYIPLDTYLKSYGDALAEHIEKHGIRLIHSASNFVNGLAANYAAKKMGIKSIYEVRGLWEITRISRQPEWENSEHFNMIKRLETEAAQTADKVVTITHALKEELICRGVDADKISVLPNGVNTKSFLPLQKDMDLMKELGIAVNETVIGYIGSIVEYEGIDLLVEAVANLKAMGIKDFRFLLVGDGRYFEFIKKRIAQLHIEDRVIVTGRIPHEEVERYYSLIDIAPLPRKALPVSEMVSPLKPFEAMAMGKVVLGSSVKAIAEIIEDGYNGMLFEKSNIDDLTDKLERLIRNEQLRTEIGKNAREWVVKERDWAVLAKQLNSIYAMLE